jgi:hypothetical protein
MNRQPLVMPCACYTLCALAHASPLSQQNQALCPHTHTTAPKPLPVPAEQLNNFTAHDNSARPLLLLLLSYPSDCCCCCSAACQPTASPLLLLLLLLSYPLDCCCWCCCSAAYCFTPAAAAADDFSTRVGNHLW